MRDTPSSVELRLLLEEVCSDLCRFEYTLARGIPPGDIRVDREAYLGRPGAFADIRIQPRNDAPFFVEVKFGYPNDALIKSLERKFRTPTPQTTAAKRVVLVVDQLSRSDWDGFFAQARAGLHAGLELEIWNENRLQEMLRRHFAVPIDRIAPDRLLDARAAIDHAKGKYAFNSTAGPGYVHDALRGQLLWHLAFWRARELFDQAGHVRSVLPPGTYRDVVIVLADICSFSSFVRDTRDSEVVRESLTAFYSKARSQIVSNGGLLYQFVGDQVVGIFGVPDRREGYLEAAFETAAALTAIGKSVANHWQRRIDRLQSACGVHIGMALGDLELLPLRPYSRTHLGFVGDSINVASRLMAEAGCDEIVITNSLFQRLTEAGQADFTPTETVEAKNVGRIMAWRRKVPL